VSLGDLESCGFCAFLWRVGFTAFFLLWDSLFWFMGLVLIFAWCYCRFFFLGKVFLYSWHSKLCPLSRMWTRCRPRKLINPLNFPPKRIPLPLDVRDSILMLTITSTPSFPIIVSTCFQNPYHGSSAIETRHGRRSGVCRFGFGPLWGLWRGYWLLKLCL
jgi:hypothetical protein